MRKLWGGAFAKDAEDLADRFGGSIESDLRFWREDVQGSIAHARMLGKVGILTAPESVQLVRGLEEILAEGPEALPKDVEDIHTAVEVRLKAKLGDVAGKLHTARSRNDQIATDTRLYLRARAQSLQADIKALQAALLAQAKANRRTIMPGVTHQQHAQPITLAYNLLAHFWALQREGWRLTNLLAVANYCPLGAAAVAGTGFPIDREATASELGFVEPIPNSLDATSDRSFVLDALHVCALTMIDLSRMSQEIVNWTGPEYGFMSLSDSLTTGSSIMPQKRNPDMAELIRGRTGRAVGNWTALATTMKGLVLGYNRDTQDDKPTLFESLDLVEDSLRLAARMVESATWNKGRMRAAVRRDFSTATDLADYLAKGGMPFREAHEVVGKLVRACMDERIGLEDLNEARLSELAPGVPKEALKVLKPEASVAARNSQGGTGPQSVGKQLTRAGRLLSASGFAKPY